MYRVRSKSFLGEFGLGSRRRSSRPAAMTLLFVRSAYILAEIQVITVFIDLNWKMKIPYIALFPYNVFSEERTKLTLAPADASKI